MAMMSPPRALFGAFLALLVVLPFLPVSDYHLHIVVQILILGFIYTAWSIMGRFGLVSLGHGAFMGIGAYGVALLWNLYGLTPWLGAPVAVALAVVVAAVIGYPCFRMRIIGHYFALVTLALSEVVRLLIVAMRDATGGSLGLTPLRHGDDGTSLYALQFADKEAWYAIALVVWLAGLWVWVLVDRSMARPAMEAISEDEDAAATIGIHVTAQKLKITVLSAALTALGGILYGQYQMYINPSTTSGIGISLQIVFAAIAGGMFVALGPTVGAVFTILLAEFLRVLIGAEVVGLDTTIYGLMLVLFIIFMPQGILGAALDWYHGRRRRPAALPDAEARGAGGGAKSPRTVA
jgi:branched-chain amino acid transport system permease protein